MALSHAISRGCSIDSVKKYLQHFRQNPEEFAEIMQLGAPVLYYAIGRNSPELLKLLIEAGIGPNERQDGDSMLPPLAFAVIHGHLQSLDTTEMVRILLASGFDPMIIPKHLWGKYVEKPEEVWPKTKKSIKPLWCDEKIHQLLAQGLNVSQRYYLYQASIRKPLTAGETQLAQIHKASGLLKLPYYMIGQLPIIQNLQQTILGHLDFPQSLVMVFAGPPGHGKTELAQQLGNLLNVESVVVPCSQMETDFQILGPHQGYNGYKDGSLLNNHLAMNHGRFSVVFLDEFDKTSTKVCDALLTLMSEGVHRDRRNENPIDCSRTIWILASNKGDKAIQRFDQGNLKNMDEPEKLTKPLVSRIDHIFPFFPFSHSESAVVAHKFLLQNAAHLRRDIDLSDDARRHMGHCVITCTEDWKICSHMAEMGYDEDSGARGLKREARKILDEARNVYNSIPGVVSDTLNDGPYERLEVTLVPLGDNLYDYSVSRKLLE
ncbi:hypothetical protein IAQ61_004652 [Plenodomus lingam]|nr:hypothetical protein IAQ61_004652 [Plenodomus lingam]